MRKTFTLVTLSLLLTVFFFPLSGAPTEGSPEARLLRFPATNSQEIAFSYAGDLWTVPIGGGEARRITSHIGYEMFARYSPDGKTIAFTGEYDGNREVYLMPSVGGEPKRLTYTSTNSRDELGDRMGPNNIVMAWTPDSKSIVFRNRISDSFDGKLMLVSPEGGLPTELPFNEGGFCSWSPDGKKLAFNRVMREFRTWKYYRGGMADEIWVYDTKTKKVDKITENPAQDIFPMWVGSEIYFASDRDMIMNIFCYDTRTKTTTKVTTFDTYDVKFPSTDGKTIVFENGGYIYTLDPATKKTTKVNITLSAEGVYGRTELKDVSASASAYSLSPDGERIVVTARGEVFDVPVKNGVTRNISRTPGSNDRGADWSPDGKYIAWIGDITNETEVYLYDVQSGGPAKQLTSGSDTYIRSLQWSPDSKTILYTDRKNRVVLVDPQSGSKRTLLENPEAEFYSVKFSPDSKWITYTKPAHNQMSVVYVCEVSSGKEYPVTEKWYNSSSPVFSTDGKYLLFTSERDLNPQYSRIEWNYSFTNMSGAYILPLAKATPSPLLPKDPVVSEDGPKGEGAAKKKDEAGKDVSVVMDTDGMVERIIKLPLREGARNFYCDGKSVYYSAGRSTRVFTFESAKDEECTDASMSMRYPNKKAAFMKGGSFYVAPLAPKVALKDPVSTKDMVARVDYGEEWPQIFDEVWRAFRDGYYVRNMHGRDWKGVKAKYEVLLPYVKTRLDLNYVIGEMISELASGHAYVSVGQYPKAPRVDMGLLGAVLSKDKSGFYKIEKILQSAPYSETLRSPLAEVGMDVKVGNYILEVDGVSVKDVDNIYALLVGKAGKLTELKISDKAGAAGGRKVVVKPIADEYPLYHYEWVQNNIKTVEKLSGGKVGYIYIPDMGPEGLREFARYYYPQLDKEALIIDDRANGGGNISPMIIERLQREVYRMTMRRTSTLTGTVPEGTHTGPKVLLINKYSASDGDLFPWSFKANNLGTVIGTRTWGGIVGISGSLPYMDGTDVRVPFFTNYDAKTGEWIVENYGVDPDILLENDPIKEYNGEDEQLRKAVEVALEQIKDRKPLPPVPADRTFKDLGLEQLK